jgi:hypothetical protein
MNVRWTVLDFSTIQMDCGQRRIFTRVRRGWPHNFVNISDTYPRMWRR